MMIPISPHYIKLPWRVKRDFKVDTYNDPREALSNFKPHYYNISLIDVRMPGMDGFDLYKELKN